MTTDAKTRRRRASENNAEIRVRLNAQTKDKAEKFFKRHGLSTGDGMRLLIDRAIREKDPWLAHEMSSHIPNAETREAIEDARAGRNLTAVSLDDLGKMILGDA